VQHILCLGGSDFKSAAAAKNKEVLKQNRSLPFSESKKHVEPCSVVLCRTMQGLNMCKKTRKTSAR
jgi:hypothetical protein